MLQNSSDEILNLVQLPDCIPIPRRRFFWKIFSGPHAPLTEEVLNLTIPGIEPFDILINPDFDILNNLCYGSMLRIIASKQIGTLHGAPPCTEYSLFKLKEPKPKPCRSPQCMNVPWCHERFPAEKFLWRTVILLRLNHMHGGYSSMEQPVSAMSWDEDFIILACHPRFFR